MDIVQLDWLRQMRHSRRPAFVRSSRQDSFASLRMAEVLEPRCVLSSVMSSVTMDDPTDNTDPANQDDSANNDGSEMACPIDDGTTQDADDPSTINLNECGDGDPVRVMFFSLGAEERDSAIASPYFTEQELHDYLLKLAQQQFGGLFGQTIPQYEYNHWWRGIDFLVADDAIAKGAPPPMAQASMNNRVTSDTNTQVSGVDEADFVETDGRFIYVARGGGLTIFDTSDQLSVASEQALSGNVVGEFLSGDRLTVITQSGYGGGWYGGAVVRFAGSYVPGRWNPQTTVTVFDVSDRTDPRIVQQTALDGGFRDARAVNGTVYVVLENSFNLPEPLYTETPVIPDETQVFITDPVDDPTVLIDDGGTDTALGESDAGSQVVMVSSRSCRPVGVGGIRRSSPIELTNRSMTMSLALGIRSRACRCRTPSASVPMAVPTIWAR